MTPAERRTLWERSLTLGERIALLKSGAAAEGESTDAADLAARWCDRCAKGDVEKFRARLKWDGLEENDVPLLASIRPREIAPEPPWLNLFSEALELFENGFARAEEAKRHEVPFADFWMAFAQAGSKHLPLVARTDEIRFFLVRRLSPLGSPAFYRYFDQFRANHSGDQDAYDVWLTSARSGGAASIFQQHPVLARALASLTLSAAATLSEMIGRHHADRGAFERHVGKGGMKIVRIDPGLSDRHYHGRQVARVEFASGKQLIYKPKSIDLDAAFQFLLKGLHAAAPEIFPPPLQTLRRKGYGWVECVAHEGFTARSQVEQYFRRGGGLLALVYALEGRDFIMDNVIAMLSGPAAIDAETALQPLCLPGGAEKMERTKLLEQLLKGRDFSVLDTGLVPLWMPASGGFYDLSGLGGQTGYVSALQQETWENIGTGAMRAVTKPVLVEPEKNQVRLNGVPQSVIGYADEVEQGFVAGYRLILARREQILGEVSKWGSLSLRFLLRTTNTYGQLMKKLLAPENLRSGLLAGIEAEILYRPWLTAEARPAIADFLREEVAALQRWDVPCFHVRADGEEHPYFLASPLAMARDRLGRLGEEDLEKQRRVVRASLRLKPRVDLGGSAQPHDPFPGSTLAKEKEGPAWRFPKASLIVQAEAIADAMLSVDGTSAPVVSDNGRTPADLLLYDGSPGAAIFFSALWVATGKRKWRQHAEASLESWLLDIHGQHFQAHCATLPVGAASGLASLSYAISLCARLLQRPKLLDTAATIAGWVTQEMLAHDPHLDVFSGAAGAALVFATLAAEPQGAEVFRQRAVWAAERLLATAITEPRWGGLVWEACGERYLGYGHGTAGIAAALSRVAALTGDSRFSEAASQAFRLIGNLFSESHRGWPHLLRGEEPVFQKMESLCHGTPGLALAFAEGARHRLSAATSLISRARERIESLDPHPIDTVCCGNAGRFEALLAIGVDVEFISALLLTVLKRREPPGLFRSGFRRSDIYACPPGFFRGLSGIGYSLLRLGEPQIFPSPAAWR
ncbi:MAG: type 2 lanthipeptide synthetase LanM [Verrucomicrobiales bacterium]